MRVAVVGGGIFGCVTALRLNHEGHDVTLFEAREALMTGASHCNQRRLHRGYHYPRAPHTILECIRGTAEFEKEFSSCVIKNHTHLYGIAPGGKTDPAQYERMMRRFSLPLVKAPTSVVRNVEAVYQVQENLFDYHALRHVITTRLRKHRIKICLGNKFEFDHGEEFDAVVIAVYDRTGEWRGSSLQHEFVEKPVVRCPNLRGMNIVIMDGEFGSMDSINGDLVLIGHVKHAIHDTQIGAVPTMAMMRVQSKWMEMVWANCHFVPHLQKCEHVESYFGWRSVLRNVEDTDERPTIVEQDGKVITIFSGKIPTCVTAAREVAKILEG